MASSDSSPEDAWIRLIERTTPITSEEAAAVFSALRPATSDHLTRGGGEWEGSMLDHSHPTSAIMKKMNWAGKIFHSTEHVQPVMVYDAQGRKIANKDTGYARLRDMKNGNDVTVAMIYDKIPVIDYFRIVSDDMVAGVMDSKEDKSGRPFYFYLKRIGGATQSPRL